MLALLFTAPSLHQKQIFLAEEKAKRFHQSRIIEMSRHSIAQLFQSQLGRGTPFAGEADLFRQIFHMGALAERQRTGFSYP